MPKKPKFVQAKLKKNYLIPSVFHSVNSSLKSLIVRRFLLNKYTNTARVEVHEKNVASNSGYFSTSHVHKKW